MTILIVDDQPDIARVTVVALQMLRRQDQVASLIAAAKQLLAPEKIDAILRDVHLAGESSLDFLSELSARAVPLPVVTSRRWPEPKSPRRRGR